MDLITIDSLNKYYNDTLVLSNLNLNIKRGQFVSIVGPFGCGKTTLLKIIAGIVPDYEGEVKVNGLNPRDAMKIRKIGYSFQKSTLLPWRNVINNILLPMEISGINKADKANELLSLIGLEYLAKKEINQLSGGMQQLVSIIRSLMLDPDILLLDEPFSSIDEISREKVHTKIMDIHKKTKKTTILVTHSISESVYLSDKVVILSSMPGTVKEAVNIYLSDRTNKIKYTREFINYVIYIRNALRNDENCI